MTVMSDTPREALVATSSRPARRRSRRGSLGSRAAYAYVAPFFVLFAAFGLYPFAYTAWVSLHNTNLSHIHNADWVGLDNYDHLFHNPIFWHALRNTFTIGVLSTVPQLLLALGLAHLLNYQMRARIFFRVAMLMPYATSVTASALIFAQLYGRDYGVINYFLHLVGIHKIDWENGNWTSQFAISSIVIWRWTGYNALIYLAGMQSIPSDLYEAATVDGAGRWAQFRHVTVPSLRPTILFTIVVSTIGATQLFGEPFLFAQNGSTAGGGSHQYQTLGLLMYQQGWTNFHLGQAASTAWTMFALIVLLVGVVSGIGWLRSRAAER